MNLTDEQGASLVEWLSEMGDLSYLVAPDPNPVGIGIRLRVQSCKHVLNADVPSVPPLPQIMYDAVNWKAIPPGQDPVAGYLDGKDSAWPAEAWAAFPGAKKITVLGDLSADIADCETEDLTDQQAADWYKQTGKIVYRQRSGLQTLLDLGVPIDHVWVADWTGQAHLYPGSWGTQYANPAFTGRDYDLSLLAA
jgi:hypothetical protein